MAALDYFPWYNSYFKKCEKLTDQELGRLARALMHYSITGERQELAGRESIAFDFIADDIDRAKDNYEAKCERNRENQRNRQRSITTDNDRQRSITTDNDRQRSITTDTKSKSKSEDKSKSENNNSPSPSAPARANNPELGQVMSFYMNRINPTPSRYCLDLLAQYAQTLGADVTIHALEIAIDEGITKWSYIQGILQNLEKDGVKSLADVRRIERERRERQKQQAEKPRQSRSEQFAAAGRTQNRTPEQMRALLDGLDKI